MKPTHTTALIAALLGSAMHITLAAGAPSANWPQFRGPNSQGVAETGKPPVAFGPDKALLWKTPLPSGVSSPCIWGNRIFVTAYDAEPKKLETICLDRKSGRIVWRKDAPTDVIEAVHEVSSPANTSPATDGRRVFVHYVTYGLVAYDLGGNPVWTRPLPPIKMGFGAGASPAVVDGKLIVKMSLDDDSHLLAVNCRNGATLWKAADSSFAHGRATPVAWREHGRTLIGVLNAGQFTALDAKTGAPLWWFSGTPVGANATPAVGEGMLYLTGAAVFGNKENVIPPPDFDSLIGKHDANQDGRLGTEELPASLLFINRGTTSKAGSMTISEFLRGGPDGKHLSFDQAEWNQKIGEALQMLQTSEFMKTAAYALRTGGRGNATNQLAWTEPKGVPEIPSPLLYRGRLYYIKNGGLFTCRDPQTGKPLYDERVGAEGGYFASPIAADGRIYVASDRGAITVLKAGDDLKVLGRAELKETIMATPAIVVDKLYVRTAGHLWAFGK